MKTYDIKKIEEEYHHNLLILQNADSPFQVFEAFRCDCGDHPENFEDIECLFAAHSLRKFYPLSVLDIGSYRHFVQGLSAAYDITSLDIRGRYYKQPGYTVVIGDAKDIPFSEATFDAIVSLCAIEHFGLGRYGDSFDIEGDFKAIKDYIRVLKPGGLLVFSTTIKHGDPILAFNAHRIYNYTMIRGLCDGLTLETELFYARDQNRICSLEELPFSSDTWHLYCGAWRK